MPPKRYTSNSEASSSSDTDGDNDSISETKRNALLDASIAVADARIQSADEPVVCVCYLNPIHHVECPGSDVCTKQKVFLSDVMEHHAASFSHYNNEVLSMKENAFGAGNYDSKEEGDLFPGWKDHIRNFSESERVYPWPGTLRIMCPIPKSDTFAITMNDMPVAGETMQMVTTKHLTTGTKKDSHAVIIKAHVKEALIEDGTSVIRANLITSTHEDSKYVIAQGAGVLDTVTGKSYAAIPYRVPEVTSVCNASKVLATAPASIRDPWFSRIASMPSDALDSVLRKRKLGPFMCIRAPPSWEAGSITLPHTAAAAYKDSKDEPYEKEFRAIILQYWSYFNGHTTKVLDPANKVKLPKEYLKFKAHSPSVLGDVPLGSWQVFKDGDDSYNMFVVSVLSIKAMWAALLKRVKVDSTLVPYSFIGLVTSNHERTTKQTYILEVQTAVWIDANGTSNTLPLPGSAMMVSSSSNASKKKKVGGKKFIAGHPTAASSSSYTMKPAKDSDDDEY